VIGNWRCRHRQFPIPFIKTAASVVAEGAAFIAAGPSQTALAHQKGRHFGIIWGPLGGL